MGYEAYLLVTTGRSKAQIIPMMEAPSVFVDRFQTGAHAEKSDCKKEKATVPISVINNQALNYVAYEPVVVPHIRLEAPSAHLCCLGRQT